MNNEEKIARYTIAKVPGLGPKTFKTITENYPQIIDIINNPSSLSDKGFSSNIINSIKRYINESDIKKDMKELSLKGIKIKVLGELDYPEYLSNISDPPPYFYYLGQYNSENFKNCISVVGTRKLTNYGKGVIKEIVGELVNRGYVVVSGMAYGADREAHIVSIDKNLPTIAVLASSVNNPTPIRNKDIYQKIINNGLIISETHPSESIQPGAFPRRNRIIAGLSLATVVIEAANKSGSLITADIAFRENRHVFAVPGNVNQSMSKGTNNLIKQNKAKLIENAEDILAEFGYIQTEKEMRCVSYELYSGIKMEIIELLKSEPCDMNLISKKLDISLQDLIPSVTMLEIDGIISRGEEDKYCLVI